MFYVVITYFFNFCTVASLCVMHSNEYRADIPRMQILFWFGNCKFGYFAHSLFLGQIVMKDLTHFIAMTLIHLMKMKSR